MGKKAKKNKSEMRKAAKRARKQANYLRCGPKTHTSSDKKSRYGTFKPGKARKIVELEKPSAKGRKKALQKLHHITNKKTALPKYPLQPLRKRRHLGAKRD